MGLRIIDCKATPSSITVFFSDAVVNGDVLANYAVQSPIGTTVTLTINNASPSYVDAQRKAVAIIITATPGGSNLPLVKDNWLTMVVTPLGTGAGQASNGVQSAAGQPFESGGNMFATQVNGDDGDIKGATKAVEDAVTFPVLTEEVGFAPSPVAAPATPAAAPGASLLGPVVAKTVSDVLGWKVRPDDPKGFIGALNASFSCKEVEGHTECTWIPRTYAVQTDLSGGISGAQASIYSRAKDALDQSLPLLDGLYALDPEADPEDVAALKSVARSQLTELVNELGMLGGPRVPRVNQYFGLLLLKSGTFPPLPTTDPDQIGGTLGNLRDELGLNFTTQDFVNTVEDEQDLSNFRILSDYVTSLAQSWINNLAFFGLDISKPFYGTQLVLLSRQLSVVAESVDEVRFALDSVFIGPAERQTLQLNFDGDPPLFVEDLLSWIRRFATEEGPGLAQDGGKFGVQNTFLPVATQLQRLVHEAEDPNPANAGLPRGFHTSRVQTALQELDDQLGELVKLASPIKHGIVEEPPPATLQQVLDRLNVLSAEVNSLAAARANLVVFPLSLDFGDQTVGTTSSPLSVTVVNFSTKSLAMKGISVSGSNPGDFAQTNTCGTGTLAAGQSCTVLVTFTPTVTGTRNATLTIDGNSVTLTGNGIP
jgi:hypothetical protein